MPAKNKNKKFATPGKSNKHKDKRKNIPTAELQNFVKDDEIKPKKILYLHDLSLDPQLVWKGKDEQDQIDLEVLTQALSEKSFNKIWDNKEDAVYDSL